MKLWEQVLEKVEPKLNGQSFDTWLKPTPQASLSEEALEVEVPSSFFAEWISSHYLPVIRESLSELHPGDLAIRFKTRPDAGAASPAPSERFLRRRLPPPACGGPAALNPRYTFDTFVVSSSNQFAHAAAKAIAEQRQNPALFGEPTVFRKHVD